MPNPIRVREDSHHQWIICGDTSYSGDVHWCENTRRNLGREGGDSARGPVAVSEVVIEQCIETGKTLSVYSHGLLSDGALYETRPYNEATGDLRVGKRAPDPLVRLLPKSSHPGPWWTRAIFTDGSLMLSSGQGFDQWNNILKP